jgi:hypothetical protein
MLLAALSLDQRRFAVVDPAQGIERVFLCLRDRLSQPLDALLDMPALVTARAKTSRGVAGG